MTRAPQDAPPTEPLRACTVRFETRRCAFVIPALDASKTLGAVLDDLAPFCGRSNLSRCVFVIDDGSTDDTT